MSTQKRRYELKARAASQEATRERIAAAAAALHEEIGVAQTTVADIARRAGVQRLTVYNHFPDLDALLPACSAHWLAEHPQPDLGSAFALEDPAERLRARGRAGARRTRTRLLDLAAPRPRGARRRCGRRADERRRARRRGRGGVGRRASVRLQLRMIGSGGANGGAKGHVAS